MVRTDVVRQRLDVLLDALADLRRYRDSVSRAKLAADRDTQHMVLHAMYVAVQAAIDLALHALADSEQPLGTTYREAFRQLAAAGRIDPRLADELEGWAGLRNVLAHHYASIDYDLIHTALCDDLHHLERLGAIASTWLDTPS
jgi:uncharacterized protein YutE (UPF0331/DUF86 family)